MDRETRRQLGGAVYRGDTSEIMTLLTPERARELPQITGQAILLALAADIPDAIGLAGEILNGLTERDWDGDAELAAEIRYALGQEAGTALAPVPVDLEQLVDLLQGGEYHSGGRLNVRTGEAIPDVAFAELIDDLDENDEDADEEWLYVGALESREAYRDMERFIAEVAPPLMAGPLSEAISGKGAFSRFRGRIRDWPDLADAWHFYGEERWLGRARLWLADADYRPVQPTRQSKGIRHR